MSDTGLFPVFEVPEITTVQPAEERKYRQSVYFDYEKGDFRLDGANKMVAADGREAYAQWCRKVVVTERFTKLSYSTDIGTELVSALAQADRAAVESAVEKTINEALMVNPKTEYVRGFAFTWLNGDALHCSFTVKGREYEELQMGVTLGGDENNG